MRLALFLTMSAIWGLTWIAIKIGVAAVPPFSLAASRLLAAGALLFALSLGRGPRGPLGRRRPVRLVASALLVNTAAYGLLFWGMQSVPSGLSAIVNLALIPVGLFSLGLLLGEERFSWRDVAAIGLGVTGLVLLFVPRLGAEEARAELAGMLALVGGTLAYCLGSILSRPLLREIDAIRLSALHGLVGGAGLAALAVAFEPLGPATLRALAAPAVLASWTFLVLGGSIVAYTAYLALLRDWGPSRAGLYAFVSPVVAVAVGVLVLGEPFGAYELAGSTVLLGAAGLALARGRRPSQPVAAAPAAAVPTAGP